MSQRALTLSVTSLGAAALLLLGACDSPTGQPADAAVDAAAGDGVTSGQDAGPSGDAAANADTGVGGDTGAGEDAGASADTGVGGDTGAGGDTATGAMALDAFLDAWMVKLCDGLATCPTGGDDMIFLQEMLPSADACVEIFSRQAGRSFGPVKAAVTEGRLLYDEAAASACLSNLDICPILGFVDESPYTLCPQVFQGTVALGAPCSLMAECAGDAYCDTAAQCPGTCKARVALGASCEEDIQCTREGVTGWPRCVDQGSGGAMACADVQLGAPAAQGQPCGAGQVQGDVQVVTPCDAGLYCDRYSDPAAPTCQAPIAGGAPCVDIGQRCEAGSICQPSGAPDGSSLCQPAPIVNEAGGACGEAFCNPFLLLACDPATNTCVAQPDGVQGAACESGDFGGLNCHEGLVCDSATDTCQPPHAAGEPCRAGDECASASCDFETHTCEANYCE